MTERNDIDVFVSFDHDDREQVRPIVEAFKQRGWAVWWDPELRIGSQWRLVLQDRLDHARAVCVIWTERSVQSTFVLDEAARANNRGVLVPVRLDSVKQPLGFGELQYADLSGAMPTSDETAKLFERVASLITGVAVVEPWADLRSQATAVTYGTRAAHGFLEQVRAMSDMFAANPGAAAGLRSALDGVRNTFAVVGDSIDDFLEPVTKHEAITIDRYRPLAAGGLIPHIEHERGHCKRIAQVYIESGGLRESLPKSVSDDVKQRLDELILSLSNADGDLFDAMASIGGALRNEAAVVTNLLLADQHAEAEARLQKAETLLLPLRQEINQGMAGVERLASDLGVPL